MAYRKISEYFHTKGRGGGWWAGLETTGEVIGNDLTGAQWGPKCGLDPRPPPGAGSGAGNDPSGILGEPRNAGRRGRQNPQKALPRRTAARLCVCARSLGNTWGNPKMQGGQGGFHGEPRRLHGGSAPRRTTAPPRRTTAPPRRNIPSSSAAG